MSKSNSRYKLKKDLYAVKENILDPYVLITAADLFEVNAGKVSVEQVTEAIKGVIGHYSATFG